MTGFSLSVGLDLAAASIDEVWRSYVELGGAAGPAELAREIGGDLPITHREHDLIAQALNECFLARGITTFPVGYAVPATPPPVTLAPAAPVNGRLAASRDIRYLAAQARHRAWATRQRTQELKQQRDRIRAGRR